MPVPTTIPVHDEAELRDAIFTISNEVANDGALSTDYVIDIEPSSGDTITLSQSLPMIRGDGSHTITIDGNGNTIDGDGSTGCSSSRAAR